MHATKSLILRWLVLCGLVFSTQVSADIAFDISIIPTGKVKQQTVLVVHREGSYADLILLTVDENNHRHLDLIRSSDGHYGDPIRSHLIDDDIILMDTGRLGGQDVVIAFSRTRAWLYDPYTNRRSELLDISSIYGAIVFGSIPKMDLFRDLNGDGRDDFIIPNFSGFLVSVQNDDGRFLSQLHVNAPPMVEMNFDNYPSYQPRQMFLADFTADGRKDLVFWIDEEFAVFTQTQTGDFSASPIKLSTGVEIDYDGIGSLRVGLSDQDQSDSFARALFRVADFDGDGVPDLVTLSVKSEGVFKKSTRYEIHKGVSREGKLIFTSAAPSNIKSRGFQFDLEEKDFNKDGQTDLVILEIELGIVKILRALIMGTFDVDLLFYIMKDGTYPEKPVVKKKISATVNLSSGDVFFPSVLIADVDGDQLDDLLVQDGADMLKVYTGKEGGLLFGKQAVEIVVPMPNDPDLVELVDLNKDGRMDLILRQETADEPRKVVVMVSK